MRLLAPKLSRLGFLLSLATVLPAQTTQPAAITVLTAVPRTIRVSSSFHAANGLPAAPVESATLAIYREEVGGTPLWQENQNVKVETDGRYSLLLGSTRNEGLPLDLFTTGEPRWLGVQFQRPGETEQPRVLLASVPYALRAADAETLGGLPASSYVVAEPAPASVAAAGPTTGAKVAAPRITSGATNNIAKFVNTTDLGNSVMFENAGKVGLGTTSPADFMHVQFNDTSGGATGYAVQNLGNGTNSFSGMLFYDQFGALGQFQGFSNYTHEYRINNIAKTVGGLAFNGSINFMIGSNSKLLVRSDGDVDVPGSMRKGGTLFLHNLGTANTGIGLSSLSINTTGYGNTAGGYQALFTNRQGYGNTGFGAQALFTNSSGNANTAVGDSALLYTTGSSNTATGYGALYNNLSGSENTASGYEALYNNLTGGGNIAEGIDALLSNTEGSLNIAIGVKALYTNTTGNYNIAIGNQAGYYITGSSNIDIGHTGLVSDDNTIRIGEAQTNTYIAGIYGASIDIPNFGVCIDSTGKLGTGNCSGIFSSRRFKEQIADMGDSSSKLFQLRPVTFLYKPQYDDGSHLLQYGLIAEEVAKLYPEMVGYDKDGQPSSVKYQSLAPMLLNELQKQHFETDKRLRQQDETIRELQVRLAALEAMLSSKVAPTAAGH